MITCGSVCAPNCFHMASTACLQGIRLVPRHSYQRCGVESLSSAISWHTADECTDLEGVSSSGSPEEVGSSFPKPAANVMKHSHAGVDGCCVDASCKREHRHSAARSLVIALGTRQGDVVLLRFAAE